MLYRERLAAAALPTGLGIILGFLLLVMMPAQGSSRLAYSSVFGLALALVVAVFAARTMRLQGQAGGIAALAFIGWVPPMMLGAGDALYTTIAGYGPTPNEPKMAAGIFVLVLMVWTLFVVPRFHMETLGRAASRVAPFVMAAGLILVIAALVRAVSRPDPDVWIARTTTVATLPVGGTMDVRGTPLVHKRTVGPLPRAPRPASAYSPPGLQDRDDSPPVIGEHCSVETATPETDGRRQSGRYVFGSACKPVELAHDARTDLWILRQKGATGPGEACVFRDEVCVQVHVTAASIAKGVAPPVGWTHGAAAGLVLALGAFLVSRKRRQEARDVEGTDATHIGGGTMRLASHETVEVPLAFHAPHGAVRLDLTQSTGSYRAAEHAGTRYLGPGTVDEVRRGLEASAAGAALASVAIVFVTAAPLAVAAICGLVL